MLFDIILSIVLFVAWVFIAGPTGGIVVPLGSAYFLGMLGWFISTHSWLITGIPGAIAWLLNPELCMSIISLVFLGVWYVCIMLSGDWAEVDVKRVECLRAVPEWVWKLTSFVVSTGLLVWAGLTISHVLL
jgi:hypothetical protein